MKDRYIAHVNTAMVEFSVQRSYQEHMQQKVREQEVLAGKFFPLVRKVGKIMEQDHYKEAESLLSSEKEALENHFVRVTYADILDQHGYALLKQGKLEDAISCFEKAQPIIDHSINVFDADRWNYEVSTIGFTIKKHKGDCLFDKLKDHPAVLIDAEEQYLQTIYFWNLHLLTAAKKGLFADSVILNFLTLGNLYVRWSYGIGQCASHISQKGDQQLLEKLLQARLLLNQGRAYCLLSKQVKENMHIDIPYYEEVFEQFEKDTAEISSFINRGL